jgi:hypothetical protein
MDGACPRCIIENTSAIVAHGSSPDAEIAPEMDRFGQIFWVAFVPTPSAMQTGRQDRKKSCLCAA